MRLFLALAVAMLVAVGVADAAPRDLVALTGTVKHDDDNSKFIVLNADNGATYYVDVSRADRSARTRQLTGRPISIIGAEGSRNDEIRAYVVDVFDQKPTVAQGFTSQPTTAFQRVHGVISKVSGDTINIRPDEGGEIVVFLGRLDPQFRSGFKEGDRTTIIVRLEGDRYMARYARPRDTDTTFSTEPTDRDQPGQPGAWRRLHGTVSSPGGARLTLRADNGREWDVDTTQIPDRQRAGLKNGELVTIAGFPAGGNKFTARYLEQDDRGRVGGPQAGLPPRGSELKIRGQASSFEGRTFRFGTIDGQLLMVDSSKVNDEEHRLLASGQPVTVTGVRGQGDTIVANRVTRAEAQDRRPIGSFDPGVSIQTVQGRVDSVSGDTLRLRTDDGRTLTLDITAVRDQKLRELKRGDRIIATGFYRGDDRSQFSVRGLREDTGSAASPPTDTRLRPADKDQCKDGGWQRFNDPTFKNQGDCVSWVERRK